MKKLLCRYAALIGGTLLLAPAVVVGQTASINDIFAQYRDINARLIGGGKIRLVVTGNPMKATFGLQKMRIAAAKFEGVVSRSAQGPATLHSAAISGKAHWEIDRPSANRQSTQLQTMILDTETASYDGATQVVRATQTVDFRREDPAAGETMAIRAASGDVTLLGPNAPSTSRIGARHMEFRGPVTMTMKGPVIEDGKPALDANGRPIVGTVNGRADRLEYRDETGKFILTGNVRIDGNHPLLFGNIDASKVEILMDAAGRIVEIDVIGSPAVTEITRRPPPRRSGAR